MKKSTLQILQLIHRLMLLGLLLFAMAAFFLKYTGNFFSPLQQKDNLLQLIAIVFSFGGVFAGAAIFKKKVFELRESQQSISEKGAAYRTVCIKQWALLEAPALFCIICFLLVGNFAFLALAAAIMLWFALTMPSKTKIMLLLQLSEAEIEKF
jgi:hypothetical protein